MAIRDFSKYPLYRWRYIIGYTAIGLLLAGLLVFAGLFVPGGLSENEKLAVINSEAISLGDLTTLAITHLPYHLLQAGIFELFGISNFTIKLPSLILGLAAAIGLIILLRRWFPPSIAILASLIAIATGQFLYIAQSGTPGIMYIFWPVMLLLLGTQVTRAKSAQLLWKVLFAITAALSLYSPLSIYILIAIVLTIALHPHLRTIIRRLSKPKLALALTLALVIVAPLGYAIWLNPGLALQLLGIPSTWPIDVWANTKLFLTQYFIFWNPNFTRVITPVFGLATMLLIILGLYRLIRTYDTTRSYLLMSWMLCLIPVQILNPQFVTIVFVPAVMLVAAGLTSLIGYWYRLFPLNPYARIAGLIPIAVLVVTLISAGVDRYVYGYHYSPQVATSFTRDLTLLPKDTKTLVVSEKEKPFYEAVAAYRDGLVVVTKPSNASIMTSTKAGRTSVGKDYQTQRIITSPFLQDSDRFYLYQKSE